MLSKEKIEEIREKINIVDVVSSYIPSLRKRGKNYIGLCPFHSEKTPSFTVSQEKGLFHCFGCGKGGNVFNLLMEMENVSFIEALKIAGDKVGIAIESFVGSSPLDSSPNKKLFSIMELACKFYESHLDEAAEYLKKRNVNDPKVFRLGFAPSGWDNLLKFLLSRGVKEEYILKTGLVSPRQSGSGSGVYDRFRNRLIFPITNHQNQIIGFGGRSTTNEDPKYLNSPESTIFIKGENLYNLSLAKDFIKKQKIAVLVEGYMDTIACFESEIKNVVAPLGTAFTVNQASLLKRFTDTVVIFFDQDQAGILASEKAEEVLRGAGISVRIATYEGAKDPDELALKQGKEALEESIKKSIPSIEFRIRRIINYYKTNEVEGKVKAAHEITKLLSKEKDGILQDEYIKFASKLLNIPAEKLEAELKNKISLFSKKGSSEKRSIPNVPSIVKEAERKLLKLALERKEVIQIIKKELSIDNFSHYKDIFYHIWNLDSNDILSSVDDESSAKILREIALTEEPAENQEKTLEDCIKAIKSFEIKRKIEIIRQSIIKAEKEGETKTQKSLSRELLELNEILRNMVR
ncbi:DNA primase [candidate division WOR-1 bacterium RIFOXYD2_FULL_36_8]|uniref:DNA primase n=1 Tax=candidate division WOR-1 bacterium RIFOXYB2_FULL_36_35 TaxID=1802578 RepID=A0A1F4S1N3_UNCSA|nr:MAG: DNA primase [candidate division WOR-1 bacterium RIFOXYA2_FULL_36_21]OGC14320.1 MAG: DNA primase [candidate division WOR-1 bacterium RIFOXYB2_FULL_36_35]OGC38123.1 MAG: DNA primase [candidate division WOR-1 bacterium RIFOXYD2_FULL_36_8]